MHSRTKILKNSQILLKGLPYVELSSGNADTPVDSGNTDDWYYPGDQWPRQLNADIH